MSDPNWPSRYVLVDRRYLNQLELSYMDLISQIFGTPDYIPEDYDRNVFYYKLFFLKQKGIIPRIPSSQREKFDLNVPDKDNLI
jgi:hypothetical protein